VEVVDDPVETDDPPDGAPAHAAAKTANEMVNTANAAFTRLISAHPYR
jgi:hypothetical protein